MNTLAENAKVILLPDADIGGTDTVATSGILTPSTLTAWS